MTLEAPHSVTEWRLLTSFWSRGRTQVCRTPTPRSLTTTKHIFMDVDVPLHVYKNETVQVRVTVTADNLQTMQNVRKFF